ncbi:M48 family metalloprotease, partial [Nocardiopsis chromatogenes]|uniref:M48 family metalloprotease n=1 Tax=Nocardiopsis chromatogenes TaxID=280239 RepID=UPI000369CA3B
MTWYTLAPAVLMAVPSLALARRPLPIHPAWSARLLAVLAVSAALTTVSTAGLLAGAFLAGVLPSDAVSGTERGRLLLEHGPVPAPVGALALALLAVGAVGAARLGLRWWRGLREVRRNGDGTGVVDDDRPMAMAVPGRRGGVVLSRGLLRLLGRDQLGVVLRHERAHLRHRHHLYAAAGALAAALFPPLAPVHRRLRFDLER